MSESELRTFVGPKLSKLKTFLFSRNVLSFSVFLILSFFFWIINTMDKERENTFVLPIRYIGLPANYNVVKANEKFISVKIRDKGINLLNYGNEFKSGVTFNLKDKADFAQRTHITISKDEIRSRLSSHFLPTSAILSIKPDSLVLVCERLATKKVQVSFAGKITPANQYILSDVELSPTEIDIYGSQYVLEKINQVQTKSYVFDELDQDVEKELELKPIDGIRFSTSDVRLLIKTEMFTEKEMIFPITILNCPPNLSLRTFPAQVKIKFNVGLSKYKSITSRDITVYLDYNQVIKNTNPKQKLQVRIASKYITNVKLQTEEVEYVIEKN